MRDLQIAKVEEIAFATSHHLQSNQIASIDITYRADNVMTYHRKP